MSAQIIEMDYVFLVYIFHHIFIFIFHVFIEYLLMIVMFMCVYINLRNINEPWIRTIELYTNEIKNIYKNVVINILRIYNDENE